MSKLLEEIKEFVRIQQKPSRDASYDETLSSLLVAIQIKIRPFLKKINQQTVIEMRFTDEERLVFLEAILTELKKMEGRAGKTK